jgi:hypothetical protein
MPQYAEEGSRLVGIAISPRLDTVLQNRIRFRAGRYYSAVNPASVVATLYAFEVRYDVPAVRAKSSAVV